MRFVAWILMAAMVAADGFPKDTNAIKSLTVEQAKALAQNKGWLRLNGLTTLSANAAAALRANPLVQLPAKFRR